MNKFEEVYLNIINESMFSNQYLASLDDEELDRTNQIKRFVKKIELHPELLDKPETISKLANYWYLLPYDKYQKYKPYIDKFYNNIKTGRNVTESVDDDNFNYDLELKIFETEIGDWLPLDTYQWDSEYLDEDDETGFIEHTFSYNDKVQVSLKKDGSIDVIDPEGNHKYFKHSDYQRAKKYITSIFKVLDQADRMRWS